MIELLRGFPDNVVAIKCHGEVTRNDYDTVLVPAAEMALKSHDKIRLLYEAGPEFEGVDAGAVWEDFKLGMEHLTRWERIAVVTDVDWIRHTFRVFSFVIPGMAKIFRPDEQAKAREWISEDMTH